MIPIDDIDRLVTENERLIRHVIWTRFPKFAFDDDVIQTGRIGLWNAARTWDKGRAPFQSYAVACIINAISVYLRYENRYAAASEASVREFLPSESEDLRYLDLDGWLRSMDKTKRLIARCRLLGYTQEEIAKITGTTRQNIQSHLRKMRKSIQKYI